MNRTLPEARRVDQAIAKLAVSWRQPLDQLVLAAYADALDDCSVEEVEQACRDAAKGRQGETEYMPAAASLRQGVMADRRRLLQKVEPVALPPVDRDLAKRMLAKIRERLGAGVDAVGKSFPGRR